MRVALIGYPETYSHLAHSSIPVCVDLVHIYIPKRRAQVEPAILENQYDAIWTRERYRRDAREADLCVRVLRSSELALPIKIVSYSILQMSVR